MDNQTPNAAEPQLPTAGVSTPITPPEKPKSYGRNWKKLILIYLAIGAVIYAGVYYFVLSKQKASQYSTSMSVPTSSPSPNLPASQSKDMKTYANTLYNYSLNYPTTYAIERACFECKSNETSNTIVLTPKTQAEYGNIYVNIYTLTSEQKNKLQPQLTNESHIQAYREIVGIGGATVTGTIKLIPLNNDRAVSFVEYIQPTDQETHNLFYLKDNLLLSIRFESPDPRINKGLKLDKYKNFSEYMQVLSTFKFTEQQKKVTLPSAIQSFPVYQNAIFVKKEVVPPCQGETSGYSNCGQTLYVWNTPDDGDAVQNWYKNDTSKSGWICGQGGAGQYTSSRNFTTHSTCKINGIVYGFNIAATEKETTITLSIKN